MEIQEYCNMNFKQLVGIKAVLYDILTKTEGLSDENHFKVVERLKQAVISIEEGLNELKDQCPSDWTPSKQNIDEKMTELSSTLKDLSEQHHLSTLDSVAWI